MRDTGANNYFRPLFNVNLYKKNYSVLSLWFWRKYYIISILESYINLFRVSRGVLRTLVLLLAGYDIGFDRFNFKVKNTHLPYNHHSVFELLIRFKIGRTRTVKYFSLEYDSTFRKRLSLNATYTEVKILFQIVYKLLLKPRIFLDLRRARYVFKNHYFMI